MISIDFQLWNNKWYEGYFKRDICTSFLFTFIGSFFQHPLPSFHYLNLVSYYLSLKLLILGNLLGHQVNAPFFRPLMSLKDGID